MKNSLPLTRVTEGTRESVDLQSHKWKDNAVNHCPNSLPNSPRKCNPDLLVRGTFFMVTGGQMTVMALGSRAAVSALQPEPTARQPDSASPECELQTLAMEQGLLYTQLAGTQGLGASSAAEV